MTELEVKIFSATTSRNALWVHCPTEQEKWAFVNWIVAKHPACNTSLAQNAHPGAAYAYFTAPSWGPDGVIDRLAIAEYSHRVYNVIDFETWFNGVTFDDEGDETECNLDALL